MDITPRARVLRALNHETPDKIPTDLGTTNCTSICRNCYGGLKELLGVSAPDRLIMRNFQICEVDEDVLLKLQTDTRGVHGLPPGDEVKEQIDERTYVSSWGITYHMPEDGLYYDMTANPLDGASYEELDAFSLPDGTDPQYFAGTRERALQLKQENRYAIVGDVNESGIFEPAWYLRGFENFLMDMAGDKEFVRRLMRKILDHQKDRYRTFLNEVGEFLDIVFVGDDLATTDSTLMSPDLYRELVKPFQKEYFDFIKSHTGARLMYHSCGNITGFLDDLIEIGVDILNPIQVSALDAIELKQRFGDRLCFWGGIDSTHVMPNGTAAEVAAEVRLRVSQLGPSGYVATNVHDIQDDVPPENVAALYRTAKEILL